MASENVVEFTDDNFDTEVLGGETPVLVDFWAEWCGPCKALGPVMDELAEDNGENAKIGKLDTDANRETSVRFSVSAIPTVILFHRGELIEKFVGLRNKKEFQTAIDKLVST